MTNPDTPEPPGANIHGIGPDTDGGPNLDYVPEDDPDFDLDIDEDELEEEDVEDEELDGLIDGEDE